MPESMTATPIAKPVGVVEDGTCERPSVWRSVLVAGTGASLTLPFGTVSFGSLLVVFSAFRPFAQPLTFGFAEVFEEAAPANTVASSETASTHGWLASS